jgi:hypothetical protein
MLSQGFFIIDFQNLFPDLFNRISVAAEYYFLNVCATTNSLLPAVYV